MSFDKAIEHKKEYRKKWTFAKRVDKRCRNHGGCTWCLGNRMHKYNKAKTKSNYNESEM